MKKLQLNLIGFVVLAFLICAMMVPAASAASEISFPVTLRGGSAQITVTIFENPKGWCGGANILAVHGLTGNANTWQPLAEAMFAELGWGRTIKRVIALDLPGHGKSPIPYNLAGGPWGNLLIDDNISVIMQTILALQAKNMAPRVLMGHSMGGLAIQGLQEGLLKTDLSLAHLGIFRAVLLAPVPAYGAEWTQGPPADVTPFIFGTEGDPVVGRGLYIPAEYAALGTDWMDLNYITVPNRPSVEAIATYVAPEPLYTLLQLVGQLEPVGYTRPAAREGAFNIMNGTLLNLVSFSQDNLVPQANLDALYPYLTGSPLNLFYRPIDTDDACHNMPISNPVKVAKTLRTLGPF